MIATRQSAIETHACPKGYVAIVIDGNTQPDSIPSERGSQIHSVMSDYVRHCARLKIKADWKYFNSLTIAAGPVAGPILDGIRDRYLVNWETVYGTEITLALDEGFRPTDVQESVFGMDENDNRAPAAYIGTLDVIELSPDGRYAKIPDYKSHPSIFEADTYQSTLYSFMLMKHLPNLESVIFELVFVRYQNCTRAVEWKRADLPAMQAIVSRGRERQRKTHENPEEAQALPCKVCSWCPLAKNLTCPIADYNEWTSLTNEDRLRSIVFYQKMRALHMPILKANAEVHGPISYLDGNGNMIEFGEQPVPSTRYPLDKTTIGVLNEYSKATGEDWEKWGLNISSTGLKSKLNTKKRAALRDIFEESLIEKTTKPRFAIRTVDGIEPETDYRGDE